MIFQNLILIAITSIFAATFRIRDMVLTRGLQNAQYDNRLAIVVGDPIENVSGQVRYPVIFWMGLDNPQGAFSGGRINIKPENLVGFDYEDPNLCAEVVFDASDSAHGKKVCGYAQLLVSLGMIKENFDIEHSEVTSKLLIGAIHKEFGKPGMRRVVEVFPFYLQLAFS